MLSIYHNGRISKKLYWTKEGNTGYMIYYITFWLDEIKLMQVDRNKVPLRDGENWLGRDERGPYCGNRSVLYLGLDDSFMDL